MKVFLNHKTISLAWNRVKTWDYFSLVTIFSAWFLVAYLAAPLAGYLGIHSTYVRFIVGHDAYVYTPFLFLAIGLGLLCFLFGYYAVHYVLYRGYAHKQGESAVLSSAQLKCVSWVFISVGFFTKLFRIFSGTYIHLNKSPSVTQAPYAALIGIGETLGILGLGIALSLYFTARKHNTCSVLRTCIVYAVFGVEFIFGFFSLSKLSVLLPVFCFLFVRHYLYGPNIKLVLLWAFVLQVVLFPIQSYLGTPSNMAAYQSYWSQRNTGPEVKGALAPVADFIGDGVFGRFDLSRTFGKIIYTLDETHEFLHGKSLKNFFVSLGPPRIIWHDKPIVNTGHNEFGRSFGILAPDDYTTSVGPGLLGDFYLNFGIGGVAGGVFLVGAVFGLLAGFFRRHRNSSYWVSAYATLIPFLLSAQESWIGPNLAGVVKSFIIFSLLWFGIRIVRLVQYKHNL